MVHPFPPGISFVKLEATGNDFVVVDEPAAAPSSPVELRRRLCHRHTGVGADGVLTILCREGRYRMHITNPDGSVPEMCGNGLRCVARHLAETGRIATAVPVLIDTDAGPRSVVVEPGLDAVTIDMGAADFACLRQFPRALSRSPLHGYAHATSVSMGNPHVVIEVDALPSAEEATRMGRAIELDSITFPERTNVEWAVVGTDGCVDVLVWERGAGLTQACGTGACAVVAALVLHGVVPPGPTTLRLPGGLLRITLSDLTKPILMSGPVRRVFAGVAAIGADPKP